MIRFNKINFHQRGQSCHRVKVDRGLVSSNHKKELNWFQWFRSTFNLKILINCFCRLPPTHSPTVEISLFRGDRWPVIGWQEKISRTDKKKRILRISEMTTNPCRSSLYEKWNYIFRHTSDEISWMESRRRTATCKEARNFKEIRWTNSLNRITELQLLLLIVLVTTYPKIIIKIDSHCEASLWDFLQFKHSKDDKGKAFEACFLEPFFTLSIFV